MFFNDNMIVAERDSVLAVINASVLSAYFLYGIPGDDRRGPPLVENKHEPLAHYRQEQLGIDINAHIVVVLWSVYNRMAFRKYPEENKLTPVVRQNRPNALHMC
jgi:hypothetical protein